MDLLKNLYVLYPTRGLICAACNLGANYYSNGYRCFRSGLYFHEKCAESDPDVLSFYHPQHSLEIKAVSEKDVLHGQCKLCRGNLPKMYYYCSTCDFAIDLICAKKEVVITIENPNSHEHNLSLVPKMIMFTCHICELHDDRFPYACNICNLSFHKDCAESTPELNYSCHPKHPLKRLMHVPSYTDGKCCLCESKLHNVFYHCSICNFSVDVDCAKNPPVFTLNHLKAHEHPLTLLPQRNFVCNACGMDDDPNPYVCLPCNFMIHRNCIDIPRIIQTNHHVHRISFNYFLSVGDWKCEVCKKEIKWTCGAYSCLKCSGFAIHLRCATKFGIWDGIEHDNILEDSRDLKAYKVIEEGVIKHYSHAKHTLKLKEKSDANDECMLCEACTYPILSSPYYDCLECHGFIIHQKCADLPIRKIDSFYKIPITLLPRNNGYLQICSACQTHSHGFLYRSHDNTISLDVRCGSISEPFSHESHPVHLLYVNYPTGGKSCKACGDKATMVLNCEECEFALDIKCSILPKLVKHKNDKDHFLSLCYGGKTSEQYWCEICEEDLDPEKWFYSCDCCGITCHIRCTLGDFTWIKPGRAMELPISLIPNNRTTRPVCDMCSSRCQFPSTLKYDRYTICSLECFNNGPLKKVYTEYIAKDLDL